MLESLGSRMAGGAEWRLAESREARRVGLPNRAKAERFFSAAGQNGILAWDAVIFARSWKKATRSGKERFLTKGASAHYQLKLAGGAAALWRARSVHLVGRCSARRRREKILR